MIDERIRFVDLYAGVGGFRLGFERVSEKFECVWSCEIDKYCRQVYRKQFGEIGSNDVREVDERNIPDFDILCAGFPCQSFSLAGKRKGFEDTRGTLFHEISKIARAKKPSWLLLENVKGLLSAQDRRAFRVVLESLDECRYNVSWQIFNSKNFGVPQNRPRVFIVGHLRADGGRPWEVLPVGGDNKKVIEEDEENGGEPRRGVQSEDNASTINRGYDQLRNTGETYIKEGGEKMKTEINPRFQILQKSPDWREDGTLREFDEDSPVIRRDMGDNLPMVLDDMYDGELRKYLDYTPSVTAHETGGWEDIKVLEHRGIIDEEPKLFDLVLSLRSESHAHQPKILHNIYGGFDENEPREFDEVSPAIRTPKGGGHIPSVAVKGDLLSYENPRRQNGIRKEEMFTLRGAVQHGVAQNTRIRKLTPVECERLQGFPDGWTEIGIDEEGNEVEISDTQRYKMMGNAVTVNVIEFIGNRFIIAIEEERI